MAELQRLFGGHTELIPVVTVRLVRLIVSFGQPRHQPPRQFRTVQERNTAQQRRDPEQQEHIPQPR
jgi:hypothetical protein